MRRMKQNKKQKKDVDGELQTRPKRIPVNTTSFLCTAFEFGVRLSCASLCRICCQLLCRILVTFTKMRMMMMILLLHKNSVCG